MNVTLRQYYAAKAISNSNCTGSPKDQARWALEVADALIELEQNYINTGLEGTVLGTPIATTGLPVYVLNKLRDIPVNCLNDLVGMREVDLLKQPNIGRKAINDIKAMLAQYGLSLAYYVR